MSTFSATEGCRHCGGTETVELECINGIDAPLIVCANCGREWDEPIEYCNECDALLAICIKIRACGRCAGCRELPEDCECPCEECDYPIGDCECTAVEVSSVGRVD